MPKVNEHPEQLRAYLFHGLDLSYSGSGDAVGECPFCKRERKFFVSQKNGLYNCKVCGEAGNHYTFIRTLFKESAAALSGIEEVAKDRRVSVDTLLRWGLRRSIIDNEWILPAYGIPKPGEETEIANLYRWSEMSGKRRLLSSPKPPFAISLFGTQFWDQSLSEVFICEGPWDAMALEEEAVKEGRHEFNIVAVPGCETFREEWVKLFSRKHVTLIYDNDAPRKIPNKNQYAPPAGYAGMKATARKLKTVVASVSIMNWGTEGYSPNLPSGFDLRDFLNSDVKLIEAI